MEKYAVLISYVGTDYCGWQKQKGSAAEGLVSIQETLEKTIHQITGESPSIMGSGRTDSGVHAIGQVAHFNLKNKPWDPQIFKRALNSLLPTSIRVLEVAHVSPEFHAQKSALKKQYSYYFQQGPSALPHLAPYSWWIQKRLNLDAMSEALKLLEGEHDYKPFQSSGAKPGPTVRRIFETEVSWQKLVFPETPDPLGLVRIRVVGSGFLKQMVRGIAGTLLQIGENRRPVADMSEILRTLDRNLVGPTAPGRALWLEKVWYDEIDFKLAWGRPFQ